MGTPIVTPIVAAVILLVSVAGCSNTRLVDNAPPGLDLEMVSVSQGDVLLRLLIDNRNDSELMLVGIELDMTLDDLEIEGQYWSLDMDVSPRNREPIELELPATTELLERLAQLDDGTAMSLRYHLRGELRVLEAKNSRINRRGFLHPVPGRPGQYR